VNPDQTVLPDANTTVGSRAHGHYPRRKRQTLSITVGQRPTEEQLALQAGGGADNSDSNVGAAGAAGATQALGMTMAPLTPELSQRSNLPASAHGVIITAVDPASKAAEEGLRPGYLIMSVNRQAVTTPTQVAAAIDAARRAGRTSVLLLVKVGNAPEAFVGIDITPQ
jgi:serine protease Do